MRVRFPQSTQATNGRYVDSGYRTSSWGTWRAALEGMLLIGTQTRIELTKQLVWEDTDGRVIVVPAGFISDGASKPWWIKWALGGNFDSPDVRAGVVHDWSIAERVETPDVVHKRFYNGMRADGMSWARATIEYRAVQIGCTPWTPKEA